MKSTLFASTATALVAMLAISTTSAVPVDMEKRLMMALSLDAQPTLPALDLGLPPTPTLPPIAGQIESMITQVIDGVTQLIPTMIPTPTAPMIVAGLSPDIVVAAPTPDAQMEADVVGKLALNALGSFPAMLMKNLAEIQSAASSIISVAATATPVAVEYVTTESGKECTKTSTIPVPTFATTGVINPLSILAQALPNPTPIMQEVTSVIGGVTSILKLPAAPAPTDLLPLLGSMQLPEIDLPMLMGNKQDACVKDANGNMIGLCGNGAVIKDSETIAL
ncbi:uncharacterized protein PSANT_01444 [Moesziomyces antarcticus]|uniref:Uncharacterized protein n=2 Tax=Pseudozyma antarctica TaxID=84753 RepID=A0A5C3FK01_PSEA2|nr:uncharacterized protein PSANT_01444 [Moesziomyces antarcticus]